jgi:3-hydroxyisobutyrate dehydrogenase-like beta-hydroxyacid dehydrogenase
MDPEKRRIGWIGLGKMGLPMSGRLLEAGFSLTVWNRTPEKSKPLEARGAGVARSPRDAAFASDVIFTMVSDDAALEQVVLGEEGILQGGGEGKLLVDMSTVSPGASAAVARAAEAAGMACLRAPVSGSTRLAEAGTLTLFVSGPRAEYERCVPLLERLGQKRYYVGEGEEARYLKLLINMMLGTTAMMVAEALAFGEKSGLDWATMVDVVGNSAVASPLIGYKVALLKERNFAPAFSTNQIAKDFDLALAAGNGLNVPMPVTALSRQFFEMMRAAGKGNLDFFGLVGLMEELAGLPRKGGG